MDSITQATLGALCGELLLAKKIGNKGILWGLLFGTLPDLDMLAYPLLSASEQISWHRGISHSIFMTVILTVLLGWCLSRHYQKIGRENIRRRKKISLTTFSWLTLYFISSLIMKLLATQHFQQVLSEKGITSERLMTGPTFSNIFLWRMIADDGENFHTSYWSIFDKPQEPSVILSFPKDHQLEEDFQDSKDLQTITWFTRGWHKTYQDPSTPNTLYIAAVNMGELQIPTATGQELKPAFIWSITRTTNGNYTLDLAFKKSKDSRKHLKKGVISMLSRALGNTDHWLKGSNQWTWDILNDTDK